MNRPLIVVYVPVLRLITFFSMQSFSLRSQIAHYATKSKWWRILRKLEIHYLEATKPVKSSLIQAHSNQVRERSKKSQLWERKRGRER